MKKRRVSVTPVREGLPGQFAFSLERQDGDLTHALPFACFRDRGEADTWRRRVASWLEELRVASCELRVEDADVDAGAAPAASDAACAGRDSWDAYMRWLEDGRPGRGASPEHSPLATRYSELSSVSIPPHPPATTARLAALQSELADVIIDRDVERELRQRLAAEVGELRERVRELTREVASSEEQIASASV